MKGKKSNATVPLTEDEVNHLHEKGILGKSTSEALLSTLCLTTLFISTFVGVKSTEACFGEMPNSFALQTDRNTCCILKDKLKLDLGIIPTMLGQLNRKMYSIPESERDPVAIYKLYAAKTPAEMNSSNAPFQQ